MLGFALYLSSRGMRWAVNRNSEASDPLELPMSDEKLQSLCPSLYFSSGVWGTLRCFFWDGLAYRYYIRDMLMNGDSRAAIVLSISPLLVASYCDDLDGVCVLRFSERLVEEHGLQVGSRLVTVLNGQCLTQPATAEQIAPDLIRGDRGNPRYVDFWPLIAEFLSDETVPIEERKKKISEAEYERCRLFGEEHLRRFGGIARDGRPDRSEYAARLKPIKIEPKSFPA
jgi:hypothetical protein